MKGVARHLLRRAARSLWENLYLNLVAAGVIAAALMLAGVYLTAMVNLNSIVNTWDRDVHVSAYFYTDLSEDRRFTVMDEVAARPEVAEVRYVSEAEAEAYLTERVEDIGPILQELGDGVLPSSLEITLEAGQTRPDDLQAFVDSLPESDIEDVEYGQEWVQRFNAFLSLLQLLGLVLGSLIFTAAVFLVGNTMHLVAYARKAELETLKLVGATWAFMATPFLLEGAAQGLIGGLLALGGIRVLHEVLIVQLQQALQLQVGAQTLATLPLGLQAALLASGVLLGVLGCLSAVHRFWRAAP